MSDILTESEVREAMQVDFDYNPDEVTRYQKLASSYVKNKTGYDFGNVADGEEVEPLAKQCAILYIKHHFFDKKYNKDFNYSLGIDSLIFDLQLIAKDKAA